MTDAPERIWAVVEPDDVSANILGDVYAQQVPDGMVGKPTPYIRADLATPKVKPLVWDGRQAQGAKNYRIHIGYGLMKGIFALTCDGSTIGEYGSEEAARDAAQSDYERRILEALA